MINNTPLAQDDAFFFIYTYIYLYIYTHLVVCDDFRQEQVNAMIAAAGSGESTDRDLVGAVSKASFFLTKSWT